MDPHPGGGPFTFFSLTLNMDLSFFFKNTMKDVNAISPILEGVVTQALKLGVNPKGMNLVNAWNRCDRTIREHIEAECEAQELGYSSLPMALKALSQLKNRQDHISYLPEVFHTFPHIWLTGKIESRPKAKDGFYPMAPSVARRKYKQIMPLLVEAWQLAERREEAEQIHDDIVKEYLSVSAEKFQDALELYIYDLEPTSLERELELLPASQEEIKRTYEHMVDPKRIYDTVTKEELEERAKSEETGE